MPESVQRHRDAARRHEAAAGQHDRSAAFWVTEGHAKRAQLQEDLAANERRSAALERRWADIIEEDEAAAIGADALARDAVVAADQESDASLDERAIVLEMHESELAARVARTDERDRAADR